MLAANERHITDMISNAIRGQCDMGSKVLDKQTSRMLFHVCAWGL